MNLILESKIISDYLKESKYINYRNKEILNLSKTLFYNCNSDNEVIKKAFEFVRDKIKHSGDIKSDKITKSASEVLENKEGICYAKSMLLAALLRGQKIPTGFCYQKLTSRSKPGEKYLIHALNAVYIKSLDSWMRLDARGNKEGVESNFYLGKEDLPFKVRKEYNEKDYNIIYVEPNIKTIYALENNDSCLKMIKNNLPTDIY